MHHEYNSDDLPAGAEACSINNELPQNLEEQPPQMSQNQIAAGIDYLIKNYKRKSIFTPDEEFFVQEFKIVEPVMIESAVEMEELLADIKNGFVFNKTQGPDIVKNFKVLRGLVFGHGRGDRLTGILVEGLKSMTDIFKQFLKDSRSQIIRETCVLIAFSSLLMGKVFEPIINEVYNHLVGLLLSKARDVPGLAESTLRWIFFTMRTPKNMRRLLEKFLETRITIQRRTAYNILTLVLDEWKPEILEKHLNKLTEYLRKGLYDTDGETRGESRRAWWAFSVHFPDVAEDLLRQMSSSQRRMVQDKIFTTGQSRIGSRINSRLASKQASRRQSRIGSRAVSPTRLNNSGGKPSKPRGQNQPDDLNMSNLKNLDKAEPKSRIKEWMCNSSVDETDNSQNQSTPNTQNQNKFSRPSEFNASGTPSRRGNQSSFRSRQGSTVGGASNSGSASRIPVPGSRVPHSISNVHQTPPNINIPNINIINNNTTVRGANGQMHRVRTPLNTRETKSGSQNTPGSRPGSSRMNNRATPGTARNMTPSQRRVMSSVTAPVSRDTSPTRRLGLPSNQNVMNRSLPKNGPPETLQHLIIMLKSPNWIDRRDISYAIKLWINKNKKLTIEDHRKLVSVISRLLNDNNSKVVQHCLEIIPDFAKSFCEVLGGGIAPLVANLLRERISGSTSGAANNKVVLTVGILKTRYEEALLSFVNCINPNLYVNMLLKLAAETDMNFKSVNSRVLLAQQFLRVFVKIRQSNNNNSNMNNQVKLNLANDNSIKIGVKMIITWSEDSKAGELRKYSDKILNELHQIYGAFFDKIMNGFPRPLQLSAGRAIERFNNPKVGSSRIGSRMTSRQTSRVTSRRASPKRAPKNYSAIPNTPPMTARSNNSNNNSNSSVKSKEKINRNSTSTNSYQNKTTVEQGVSRPEFLTDKTLAQMNMSSSHSQEPILKNTSAEMQSKNDLMDLQVRMDGLEMVDKTLSSANDTSAAAALIPNDSLNSSGSGPTNDENQPPNDEVNIKSPLADKKRSESLIDSFASIHQQSVVQKIQLMRQLESVISLDKDYWKSNQDKCVLALNAIISCIDHSSNNPDGIKCAALCALQQLLKLAMKRCNGETASNLVRALVDLHIDKSKDISDMSKELLSILVDKIQLCTVQEILYESVVNNSRGDNNNHVANLSYGLMCLLANTYEQKYEDILLEMSTDFTKEFIFPVGTFVPSLLNHFASGVPILRKVASDCLIHYIKFLGESQVFDLVDQNLNPKHAQLLKLHYSKKRQSEASIEVGSSNNEE